MVIGLLTREQIEALDGVAARLDARGLADEGRIVREVLAQLEHAPRQVPAAEAARILAVTPQTVRNWVRGGVLPGRRDRTGHFYVELDALEPALRLRHVLPDAPAGKISDAEIDAEIEAARNERHRREQEQTRAPRRVHRIGATCEKEIRWVEVVPVD